LPVVLILLILHSCSGKIARNNIMQHEGEPYRQLMFATPAELPEGVRRLTLNTVPDERGEFTEMFRATWAPDVEPCQWNIVRSRPSVLRGVHVHFKHADYLTITAGHGLIGLVDLRPESPTYRSRGFIEMRGDRLNALIIPVGVAHGFYFFEASMHCYAVTEYWDMDDELGCRFDDPDLGLHWPNPAPLLSPRDRELPPLRDIMPQIEDYFCGRRALGMNEKAARLNRNQ
jgi:dTDP-4-dehydrorhamnose 3,5-epimerase